MSIATYASYSNSFALDSIHPQLIVTRREARERNAQTKAALQKCYPQRDPSEQVGGSETSSQYSITNMPEVALTLPSNSIFDHIDVIPDGAQDFRFVHFDNPTESAGSAVKAGKPIGYKTRLPLLGPSELLSNGSAAAAAAMSPVVTTETLRELRCDGKSPAQQQQQPLTTRLSKMYSRILAKIAALTPLPEEQRSPLAEYVEQLVNRLGVKREYEQLKANPSGEPYDRSNVKARVARLVWDLRNADGTVDLASVEMRQLANMIQAEEETPMISL